MAKEQEATLAGLQTALQMEIDGKEFYLKASKTSKNALGKELLKKLAAEEDIHREIFKKIFDTIKSKKDWPDVTFQGDGGSGLRTVFAEALEAMDKSVKSISEELDAVKAAMDMENKTYDFYSRRGTEATYEAEKELYASLAMQESEHYRVLLDYYDFLQDPAGWFVKIEHTAVDGG
jgi:rubrerythrin